MNKLKKVTKYILILLFVFTLTVAGTLQTYAKPSVVDATNYEENREEMEKTLNGSNIIEATSFQEYTFGNYGRVHIDLWNTTVISSYIDADGYHSITFKANNGYNLPTENLNGTTRFTSVTPYSTQGKVSYSVNAQEQTGTLRFNPAASKDTYNSTPILVRLVGIESNIKQDKYLTDFAFIEVLHQAVAATNEELNAGISFQMNGSKTYLVKKKTTLKVYVTTNPYFMPIESTLYTTGVNDGSTDFSNRYFVIDGIRGDRSGDTISYTSTAFNVKVWDVNKKAWVTTGTYDFYHQNNTINMPDVDDQIIALPGYRIAGYKIQRLVYQPTINNVYTWANETVALDDSINTSSLDYNKQWTSTGIDGGYNPTRESSLRHRYGNVFITPIYVKQFTVRFIDFDNQILNTQVVDENTSALSPNSPSRDGYDFTGWDKDYSNITSNLDVYATYQKKAPEKVTVTFVDYDNTVLKSDSIDQGTSAIAPKTPSRDGYRFTGWDKDFTNVQNNLTVTATYEKLVAPAVQLVKVTFVDYDGNIINVQEIEKGTNAKAPTNPQRQGYTFIGWDKTFTNVQSDLTVTAQYQLNEVVVPPIEPTTPSTPNTPTLPETPVLPEPVLPSTPNITITENETIYTTTETTNNSVANETQTVNTDPTVNEEVTPINNDIEIDDQDIPLANNSIIGSWALINLIATILTTIIGILLVFAKHQKNEENNEQRNIDNEDSTVYNRRRWTKVLAIVTAIISIVAFILTENITLPMILIDKWTLAMVIILIVQIIIFLMGRQWKEKDLKQQTQN